MVSYYNFLPLARLDQPVVSVPYIDGFGTGNVCLLTQRAPLPPPPPQQRQIANIIG